VQDRYPTRTNANANVHQHVNAYSDTYHHRHATDLYAYSDTYHHRHATDLYTHAPGDTNGYPHALPCTGGNPRAIHPRAAGQWPGCPGRIRSTSAALIAAFLRALANARALF
jgi:hypothetical protein